LNLIEFLGLEKTGCPIFVLVGTRHTSTRESRAKKGLEGSIPST
jgi:hypothetical protein